MMDNLEEKTVLSRRQKKRRRKQKAKEVKSDPKASVERSAKLKNTSHPPQLKGRAKKLQDFKETLGLQNISNSVVDVEYTASIKDNVSQNIKLPEVVVFDGSELERRSEYKVPRSNISEPVSKNDNVDYGPKFNLNQARFEVLKFGIGSLKKKTKKQAMTALLVKLGAKPMKNQNDNYRVLLEKKKAQKEKDEMNKDVLLRAKRDGHRKKDQIKKRKKGHTEDRIRGFLDGQVGKYKRGVQMVSKEEIRGARTNKKSRRF